MADYYPLLVKALETQGGDPPANREAIYARARAALAAQLDVIRPPLTPDEIERERRSLDDAISRVEALQPGAAPAGVASPGPASGESEAVRAETSRPRMPVSDPGGAIRRGGSRRSPVIVAGLLCAVAAPMAFLGWSWRGQARAPLAESAPTAAAPAPLPAAAPKLGERLGGLRLGTAGEPDAPAPAGRPAGRAVAAAGLPAAPASAAPPADPVALAVAQRVILAEESAGDAPGARTRGGRAIWRLDSVPGGPGLPLETVVRVDVDLAEAGFTLAATLRRNTDAALPASHLMELLFTPAAGDGGRSVREIGLPLLRLDEGSRGLALVGGTVPVKENVFLVGLSDTKADTDRNRELLLGRAWLEVPIRFSSGGKALILIEKGVSGDRLLADAFRSWDGAR